MKNLKLGIKLPAGFAFLVVLILLTGGLGGYGLDRLGENMNHIAENSVPGLQSLATLNQERMAIRAQTLDVLIHRNTFDAREEYLRIIRERDASWTVVEQAMSTFQAIPEASEAGRSIARRLMTEYQAWRDIYARLDAIIHELAETMDQSRKAQLYADYVSTFRTMVPISNTMGATFVELTDATNTAINAQVQTDIALAQSLERYSIAAIILAVLMAAILSFLLTRSITIPIGQVVTLLKEVAGGNVDRRLKMNRGDEIGVLADALDGMADNLTHKANVTTRIADGNLNVDVQLASENDQMGLALQTMIRNLNDILGQIWIASEQIASGSGQVADSSQALSQGATESASSLEEISASLHQLSSQTSTNAANANAANQLATEVRTAAEQGNRQMQAMVAAMTEINAAGQNISKIIKVIDEIAFQTNLLALNAAVEAARAGQHGKGFAVVAEEVRNLAARSAKAAKETSELIEGSVQKTASGSSIADQTATALDRIVSGIGKVTDLISEIAAASSEQAQGVNEINQGVNQIDQVTQQNTASAEESAAASEELSGQAAQMREMLMRFTLKNRATAHPSIKPVAQRPQQLAPPPAATGWGQKSTGKPQAQLPAKHKIALDDEEFGKF